MKSIIIDKQDENSCFFYFFKMFEDCIAMLGNLHNGACANYTCTWSIPSNATLVSWSDQNLTSNVENKLYESEAEASWRKCAYVCNDGYEYNETTKSCDDSARYSWKETTKGECRNRTKRECEDYVSSCWQYLFWWIVDWKRSDYWCNYCYGVLDIGANRRTYIDNNEYNGQVYYIKPGGNQLVVACDEMYGLETLAQCIENNNGGTACVFEEKCSEYTCIDNKTWQEVDWEKCGPQRGNLPDCTTIPLT